MRFSELIAKQDLTNRERDNLVQQAQLIEGSLYDMEDLVNAIKGSGLIYRRGEILAGGRKVRIDKYGITFIEASAELAYFRFVNASNTRTAYIAKALGGDFTLQVEESGAELFIQNEGGGINIRLEDGSNDTIDIINDDPGQDILIRTAMTDTSLEGLQVQEDPGDTNKLQVDMSIGPDGCKFTQGGETEIHAGKDGEVTKFNASNRDIDFLIEGDTVEVFKIDAGLDQVLAGTTIAIKERADQQADIAGYGQLWVKSETPCELWFTDDTGTDTQLA